MTSQPNFQFLSTAGDGTGTVNAIGDYTTPDDFYMEVPAGQARVVTRLAIYIEDSTMQPEAYGALAALTNGVRIFYKEKTGASEVALDGGQPIKASGDYGKMFEHISYWVGGAGNHALYAHLEMGGHPLRLTAGGQLIVRLSDNLTGLAKHTFVASWHTDI